MTNLHSRKAEIIAEMVKLAQELAVIEAQIEAEVTTTPAVEQEMIEVVEVETTEVVEASEYTVEQLQSMKATEVKEVAKSQGIATYNKAAKKQYTKAELIALITGTEVVVTPKKASKKSSGMDFAKWMRDITENY